MRWQTTHQSPSSYIPQEHRLIIRPASNDVSLWRKRQTVYIIMMPPHRRHVLASLRLASSRLGSARHAIPQPNRLVVRPARQRIAIRSPSNAAHARHVSHQRVHVRARRRVPNLDGRVCRRRRDELAIRRDAHLRHGLCMAVERQARTVIGL